MIDRIDYNVQQTQDYVKKAVTETAIAVKFQKSARRVSSNNSFYFCFCLNEMLVNNCFLKFLLLKNGNFSFEKKCFYAPIL